MQLTIIWDIPLCSPLEVNRRFRRMYLLHLQGRIDQAMYKHQSRSKVKFLSVFTLASFWAYSTLKMAAIYSSETSLSFQRISWRCMPEDGTPHNPRCENLHSCSAPEVCLHIQQPRKCINIANLWNRCAAERCNFNRLSAYSNSFLIAHKERISCLALIKLTTITYGIFYGGESVL
jgi:hypothetical protein